MNQTKSEVKTAEEILQDHHIVVMKETIANRVNGQSNQETAGNLYKSFNQSLAQLTKTIESVKRGKRYSSPDFILWNHAIDAVLTALGLSKEASE